MMLRKIKYYCMFIVFTMLLSTAPMFAFAGGDIIISINGQPLQTDVGPIIQGDVVLAPIRAISEALDFTVVWDEAENTVYISDDFYISVITIGDNGIKRSRYMDRGSAPGDVPIYMMEYKTDAEPILQNERTLLPLRAISECLNADVEWIPGANTISVTYNHALDAEEYDYSGYVKPDIIKLSFFSSSGEVYDTYDFESKIFMTYATGGDADEPVILQPLAFYMVKGGDTVIKIATRYYGETYKSKYDLILQANNINNTSLKIGEMLIIPLIP